MLLMLYLPLWDICGLTRLCFLLQKEKEERPTYFNVQDVWAVWQDLRLWVQLQPTSWRPPRISSASVPQLSKNFEAPGTTLLFASSIFSCGPICGTLFDYLPWSIFSVTITHEFLFMSKSNKRHKLIKGSFPSNKKNIHHTFVSGKKFSFHWFQQ